MVRILNSGKDRQKNENESNKKPQNSSGVHSSVVVFHLDPRNELCNPTKFAIGLLLSMGLILVSGGNSLECS